MKKIIAFLLIAAILLSGCSQKSTDGILSDFSTKDINGNAVDETIFADKKVTMINIWGTYCGPCVQEMPALAALSEKYQDSDFQIIGLISDVANVNSEEADSARSIMKYTGAEYPNLIADRSMLALLQTVMAVPTTIFVNEKGEQIGEPYVGARDQDAWESIIAEVMEHQK